VCKCFETAIQRKNIVFTFLRGAKQRYTLFGAQRGAATRARKVNFDQQTLNMLRILLCVPDCLPSVLAWRHNFLKKRNLRRLGSWKCYSDGHSGAKHCRLCKVVLTCPAHLQTGNSSKRTQNACVCSKMCTVWVLIHAFAQRWVAVIAVFCTG